jgi:hypothetical protein
MRAAVCVAAAFAAVVLSLPAESAEPVIGNVLRVEGEATGVSEGASRLLSAGNDVHHNESVTTGADARLELAFADGTHLTVGERSRIILDEFVFDAGGTSRFRASVTGPFRYISGKLAAGATRDASIVTPFATIGVRGTDFWGGPIDGANGVVVFEGEISVTTASGTVILSAPRQGANFAGPGTPPVIIPQWSQDKIDRAIATVTFR